MVEQWLTLFNSDTEGVISLVWVELAKQLFPKATGLCFGPNGRWFSAELFDYLYWEGGCKNLTIILILKNFTRLKSVDRSSCLVFKSMSSCDAKIFFLLSIWNMRLSALKLFLSFVCWLQDNLVTEKKGKPESLNAFELISKTQNLENLFENQKVIF